MGPQALAISSKDGSSLAASSSSKSRLRQPWVRRRHGITAQQSTWEQQRAPSSLQTSSCAHSRHAASAVSDPGYASSLPGVAARLIKEEGVIRGFYSGFWPILFKQVPYTMAKFAVQGRVAEAMYKNMGKSPSDCGALLNTGVSLSSGVVAGVVSAIISHPADTLLSKVNKAGAGGDGSIPSRMMNITKETGVVKLCTQGLGARCVMIGTLTALQFGIFDTVMRGLGAEKFHFHAPA